MTHADDMTTFGKVAVLLGGFSAEREVSLRSGAAVLQALRAAGVDAHAVDPQEDGLDAITENGFDRVWNALHGRKGEDGVMQGFLELHDMPYTGNGVMASAVAMDKDKTKQIWRAHNLPLAKDLLVETGELALEKAQDIINELGSVMVKPIREGSSVGMAKANTAQELVDAVVAASEFDRQILLEQWIDADEYTVAILHGKALPSIRLQTPNDFYDYQAKYQSQETEYFCPSGLSDSDEAAIGEIAEKAFVALDGHGWGRVDFLRDKVSGQWVLLEANMVPGMTESSLVPKAAKQAGMSFKELVVEILKTSMTK